MKIYRIVNLVNGKQYIGQTVQRGNNRFSDHKAKLNTNTHGNPHLQAAWNQYGEENFRFEILEEANSCEELNLLEEKYVKKYKTLNNKYGYNIRTAGSDNFFQSEETKKKISKANKGNKHSPKLIKRWAKEKRINNYAPLLDPDGNKVIVDNLRQFCRENNLDRGNIMALMKKQTHYCKGWRRWEDRHEEYNKDMYLSKKTAVIPRKKLISPDGIIHEVQNINRFCKEYDLGTHIRSVMKGTRKSHKGWRLYK